MDLTLIDLTGRTAVCGLDHHATAPSSDRANLFLFTYTGPGSMEAEESCRHCRFYRIAHVYDPTRLYPQPHPLTVGHVFEPLGPQEFDRFVCSAHIGD